MNLEELKSQLIERLGMTPQELDDTFRVAVKENSAVLSWRWLERGTFIAFARWLDEVGGERRGTQAEIPLSVEEEKHEESLEKYRRALEILMQRGFFKKGGLIAVEEWLRQHPKASLETALSATRGLNPEEVPVVEAALKGETVDIDAMFPGGREGDAVISGSDRTNERTETTDTALAISKRIVPQPTRETAGFEPAAVMPRKFSVTSDGVLTTRISLAALETGIFTPRRSIDWNHVDELAESLSREGQFKPVIVRLDPENQDRYQLVDGEHRVAALKKLHRMSVRAEVRQLSDFEATALAMKVNMIHGLRLNELDEAYQIKRLRDEYGKTEEEIARIFNRPQSWISYRLSLVERAAEPVQQAIITRVITPVHARELVKLDKTLQGKALEVVKDKGLSTRETKKLVENAKEDPEKLDVFKHLSKEEVLDGIEGFKPATEETIESLEPEVAEAYTVERCPHCGAEIHVNWLERIIT